MLTLIVYCLVLLVMISAFSLMDRNIAKILLRSVSLFEAGYLFVFATSQFVLLMIELNMNEPLIALQFPSLSRSTLFFASALALSITWLFSIFILLGDSWITSSRWTKPALALFYVYLQLSPLINWLFFKYPRHGSPIICLLQACEVSAQNIDMLISITGLLTLFAVKFTIIAIFRPGRTLLLKSSLVRQYDGADGVMIRDTAASLFASPALELASNDIPS
jgi:hypothetical protein